MDANKPGAPKKLTAAERRAKALEARKAGFTYQAIGDSLGITQQAAHKTVMVALGVINDKIAEAAEEVRTIELERIDALFKVMYARALRGDYGATDRCIRLMDRRAKYLGLDAPKSIDITSGGETLKQYAEVSPNDWDKE